MLNAIIAKIRPGKKVSADVNNFELILVGGYYGFCLIRGVLQKILGVKGRISFIGADCRFSFRSKIFFGKYVKIGDQCILSGLGRNGLIVGDNSSIGSFSRIVVSTNYSDIGSHINIGRRVGIGEYSSLGGSGGVTIGDDTIIAQYFSAHPENHIYEDVSVPIRQQGTRRSEICIGEDCWIGAKVTVLAGVTIGKGSIIGAGSVVTKNIPPYSIAIGNPARVVKTRGTSSIV